MDTEGKQSAEVEAEEVAKPAGTVAEEDSVAAKERAKAEKKAAKEQAKAEKQAAKERAAAEKQAAKERAAAEKQAAKEAEERLKMQKSLRLKDQTARSLLDRLDTAVGFHDLVRDDEGAVVDYRVLEVNRTYEGILGLTPDEVIGEAASTVYGRGKAAPFLSDILAALEEDAIRFFEGPVRSTRAKLRMAAIPMGDELFALMIDDVTAAKKEESRAKARRSYLETRLKNLTEQKQEVDGTLTATSDELSSTRDALAAAQKDVAKKEKLIAGLEGQVDALNQDKAGLTDDLAQTRKALEDETAKLKAEIETRKQLEASLAAALEARDRLRGVLGDLNKAVES